jgi:DNA-binding transcriptional MerR regulator
VYGPQDAQWVSFLHRLRETGMPIRELQRYCALREQGDATLAARLALLERHTEKVAAELRATHEHLARLRETIGAYQQRLAKAATTGGADAAVTAAPPPAADRVPRR